ncbi:polysaccharide deacetylase family protein [Paenibacillus aestuarii]|uniref:Polysaccharide deacetylase family protein n=1 Tax=Paenibacillus aestuarii TaxID=516965 RepID=A0ABW0KHN1_9BACL|nr:polysaccharide deacetylase family protein [Paenibacillus aestuarii]
MHTWRRIAAILTTLMLAAPLIGADQAKRVVAIPVLNYHSIGDSPGNIYMLRPDHFARQMDYLAAHQYTPLTLQEFALILEKKKVAPDKPVLLTFDDGYASNYELAMPVLKSHDFPATVFILPGMVGQGAYLSWPQIREMRENKWDVQPHTMTHPHLPQLAAEAQREEIVTSRHEIERQLGTVADVFAYPYGEYNETTLGILQEAGFRYAFTTLPGMATSAQPPLELHRIVVQEGDSFRTWKRKLKKNTH